MDNLNSQLTAAATSALPCLSSLSDDKLLITIHSSVLEERKITAQVVSLLEEVDRRKLYLQKGYGSLIEFCIRELKYSESSAYRRISAMRVCRDIPQVQEKIIEGALSLSVLSQAQSFIRQEEKHTGERFDISAKASLLKELENKSSREVEKILIEKSPHLEHPEKVRVLTADRSELRLTLDQETLAKLEKIKSLISHKNPNVTYSELIELMADITLNKIDPELKAKQPRRQTAPTHKTENSQAQVRREVWRRAQGQCCYQDPVSKRRCSSRFQLQVDHVVPKSRGGSDQIESLQLLCREHNNWKGFR